MVVTSTGIKLRLGMCLFSTVMASELAQKTFLWKKSQVEEVDI